jgi:hypothetical protein
MKIEDDREIGVWEVDGTGPGSCPVETWYHASGTGPSGSTIRLLARMFKRKVICNYTS